MNIYLELTGQFNAGGLRAILSSEKDYAVIGELARRLGSSREQLLLSRSARDLVALASAHAALLQTLVPERPLLALATGPLEKLEAALDAERRDLMHANERRGP